MIELDFTITLKPRGPNSPIWVARVKEHGWVTSGANCEGALIRMGQVIDAELKYDLDRFISWKPRLNGEEPSQ